MALRRYWHAAAFLLTCGIVFASCSSPPGVDRYGIPLGDISAQQVAKNPLAHLYYPGSKPFFMLGTGSTSDGPAGAGALVASSATGRQIYAWYTKKLASLGWSFVTDRGCLATEPDCPQYGHDHHGNREGFYLAITNPAFLPQMFGARAPPACTVYEMSYEIFPPGGVRSYGPPLWNGGNGCWWNGSRWSVPNDVPDEVHGAP
jgi:hypothetical protein